MNRINIKYCAGRINTQEIGTSSEHVMSIVYFNIGGVSYECKVQQPYGGEDGAFEDDALEVHIPNELRGKIHVEQFHDATEEYYRKLIGRNGMLKVTNVKNMSVMDCFFELNHTATVDSIGKEGGW